MRTTTNEFGYQLTWGAVRALAVIFFLGWMILVVANEAIDHFGWRAFDETDDATRKERSGLRLYHDHGTGCQYLATRSGLLTPRLDSAGKPICHGR